MSTSKPSEKGPQEQWTRLQFAPAHLLRASVAADGISALVLLGSWLNWLGPSITTGSFTISVFICPAILYAAARQISETGWDRKLVLSALIALLGLALWTSWIYVTWLQYSKHRG
jgi:hypothetical protein